MSGKVGATDGSTKDQQIAELASDNRNLQESLVTKEEECQRLQDETRRLREKVANARDVLKSDEEEEAIHSLIFRKFRTFEIYTSIVSFL
eukprot:CAMPEP_0170797878 /NCGR_PEP_ID=MMETSP0733-20121128/25932_1 /TAXON_ID=186038 /ORGANISM="Fragilariopsis kerguelensis, Strain L26-C5" /LENGTH=89 /DNA_ID=CAMNT_0011148943 /DNA_START=125 /DNA_END=394 /DNA_ORIENTATION=+